MIAVDKMTSGPTSISLTTTNAMLKETSLQGLYKNSLGDLDSIDEIQCSSMSNDQSKGKLLAANDKIRTDKLIETKFNELAAKIFEELRQVQYSKEFFKAIDEIIKEPPSKSLVGDLLAKRRLAKQTTVNINRQPLPNKYYGNYRNTKQHNQQQANDSIRSDRIHDQQPRSLPLDVTHLIQRQEMKKQQKLQQFKTVQSHLQRAQQQQQTSPRSSIPKMNGLSTSSPKRQQVIGQEAASSEPSRTAYPISKSATSGETLARISGPSVGQSQQASLPALKRSATVSVHGAQQANFDLAPASVYLSKVHHGEQATINGNRTRRLDTVVSPSRGQRFEDEDEFEVEGDERDEDDECDDDDDDDDFDDIDEISLGLEPRVQNQRFNPIMKSKTMSDASDKNGDTQRNLASGQVRSASGNSKLIGQQQIVPSQLNPMATARGQPQAARRPNSVVRSNTVAGCRRSMDYELANKQATSNNVVVRQGRNSGPQDTGFRQTKSMVLSNQDVSHLYKPHMNYSTSLLGNHRLSDDDEIIIIPTQSPSLISSTSPDGESHADELAERFSISRTKSFWERLSKGSAKPASNSSGDNYSSPDNNNLPDSTTTGGPTSHQHHQSNHQAGVRLSSQDSGQRNLTVKQSHPNASHQTKQIGGRMVNGHAHTLDRMDSTGGSNSNYSCSSSGDENTTGSHSRPTTVNQMQLQRELSRQNRFRQTR